MEHIPHQPHKAAQQELFNNFAGNAPKRSMSWRHQSLKKPPARLRSWRVTPARPTMTAPLSCSHPRGRKRAMAHRGDTHGSPQPAPITRGGGGTKWRAGPGRAGERLRHVAPHRPSRPGGDGRGGRRKEPRGAAMGRKKKKKGPGAAASRLVVTFDEERRREYLTGFHKRKVERRKVALEEIKKKLKEEQRKMKEERHKEYLKMLSEREEALEEFDELEHLVTSRTESVNIDHPNHIVTVTTISDLDLSGARQLGLTTPEGKNDGSGEENGEEVVNKPARTVPKKSRNPLLSEKISALTATLHMHSRKKSKGKRPQRGQGPHQKIKKPAMRRTTKTQRRRLTGKMGRDQD